MPWLHFSFIPLNTPLKLWLKGPYFTLFCDWGIGPTKMIYQWFKVEKLLLCVFPCPVFCLSLELQTEQAVFACLINIDDPLHWFFEWHATRPITGGGGFGGWTGTGWVGLREESRSSWSQPTSEVWNELFQRHVSENGLSEKVCRVTVFLLWEYTLTPFE